MSQQTTLVVEDSSLALVTSHSYRRVQKLGRWLLHWCVWRPIQIYCIVRDCIFPPIAFITYIVVHQSMYYTVRYLIIPRSYELFIQTQSQVQFSASRNSYFQFQKVLEPAGSVSFFLVRKKCFDQIKVILCSYVQCNIIICYTVSTDVLICGSLCIVIADLYKWSRYRGRCWPALRNSMHALTLYIKLQCVQRCLAMFLVVRDSC